VGRCGAPTQTEQDTLKAEIGIAAVSLATSVIEEAGGMAFDKNTDTNTNPFDVLSWKE